MKTLNGFLMSAMVLMMTGAAAQAGTDYTINVRNNSANPQNFEVYQKAPDLGFQMSANQANGMMYQNAVSHQQKTNTAGMAATMQGVSQELKLAPNATAALTAKDGSTNRVVTSMTGDCSRVREAGGAYIEQGHPMKAAAGYTINVVNESPNGTCALLYQ